MVFNGETNNLDICTTADDLIGTDDVSFPLQRKARYASLTMSEIWRAIFKACNGWQFIDKNDSGDPYGDVNSVANTNKITIPTAAETITGAAYLEASTSEYRPLKPITEEEIIRRGYTIHNFMNTAGVPRYYLPKGLSLYIYPALSTTTSNAYRVYFDRAMTTFASTDTTKTPGIVSDYHSGVAVGMAKLEAPRAMPSRAAQLAQDWKDFLSDIANFYALRYKENKTTLAAREDYIEGML